MGVEEHRKRLMANNPVWGDQRSTHVASAPRENPDDVCDCEVEEPTTPIDPMNYVVNPSSPSDSRISTYGWTFEKILKTGQRFREVPRVALKEAPRAISRFDREGVPLIIEGLHKQSNWLKKDLHPDWLEIHGPKEITVRNVYDWNDKIMALDQFIQQSRSASTFASPEEEERLYGKDAPCPERWAKWLRNSKVVPSILLPGNDEDLLLSHHVETLMCYIGVGDTFTPCHKDLCASSGQNLMCYTEMDGSSFWFMTKGADAPEASKYFHQLKQELDHETHVITIDELANAPFDVFIAEQKLGDLVLVPPRSCHQVVNYGGITIKTSWSRMTLKGLETAYYHELPIYRRVCRPEIYRVKSTIYYTLIQKRDVLLSSARSSNKQSRAVLATKAADEKLISITEDLLKLFDSILLEEYSPHRHLYCLQPMPSPSASHGSPVASSTVIDPLSCDFCGADIFQSFFECLSCVDLPKNSSGSKVEHGYGFVICPGCYIEGRTCKCGDMDPIQCRPFEELLAVRNKVANLLSAYKSNPISLLKDSVFTSSTGTFRSACLLQEMRKNLKREERTCSTTVVGSGHVVPCSWVLSCKKCHRSRCFTHILVSQKLHAADALLIHASDLSHEEHHRHHGSSVQKYNDGRDSFFQAQRMGSKPDLTQQRVHLAEQYRICKPINSAFIQEGWYDAHVQLLPVSMDSSQDSPTSGPVSPPLSPLTELDSPRLSVDVPPSVNESPYANASAPLKRKRKIMDFVAVPNRSYKITSQVVSSDQSTSSTVANDMLCEQQEQEVMQTDAPESPPTRRHNISLSSELDPSPLETKFNNLTSSSQNSKASQYTFKKRRPLPTPSISNSTPTYRIHRSTSYTSVQSPQPMNRHQTKLVTFSARSKGQKSSRLEGSSSTAMILDQSSGMVKSGEEKQHKIKLLRFKKKTALPEVYPSSSSSTHSRSTPSDDSSMAQVINGAVNKNQSALEALNTDPITAEPTPSIGKTVPQNDLSTTEKTSSDNNDVLQISPNTPVDRLDKAIKHLTEAARTINQFQSQHIQPHDMVLAVANALSHLSPHHTQSTVAPPTPGWFQGNLPMLRPLYPPISAREWSALGSPQYQDMRYQAALPFEGSPNSHSPAYYDHIPHEDRYYDDGPTQRFINPGRRQDSYREDHNRRWNNRSHPYSGARYSGAHVRGRPPRPTRFDNLHRRSHSFDNRSFISSHYRTKSSGGRAMPEDDYPTEFSLRTDLGGTKSLTSTFQNRGTNDETPENSSRACPSQEPSPRRWPSPVNDQPQSPSLLHQPTDRLWERESTPQVQQPDDSVQCLPPLAVESSLGHVEIGPSLEHHGSLISADWEDNYEQEDVIDNIKEVPRIEPSKVIQREFPSPPASLYDNPWVS